jgi:hypothetical protein
MPGTPLSQEIGAFKHECNAIPFKNMKLPQVQLKHVTAIYHKEQFIGFIQITPQCQAFIHSFIHSLHV